MKGREFFLAAVLALLLALPAFGQTITIRPPEIFAGSNPAQVDVIVRGAAGQTADLQQWQNSAGAVLSRITAAGAFSGPVIMAGFTPGSVLFAGAGGAVTEDNANFFWDDAANTLKAGGTLFLGAAGDVSIRRLSATQIGTGIDDTLRWEHTLATGNAAFALVSGDTNARISIRVDGRVAWGTGAVAEDTELMRSAANILALGANDSLTLGTLTFATLGTPANGTIVYCSDCTIANPCAGGGTGAQAKRINGGWICN